MAQISLAAQSRDITGKKVASLRDQNLVPAVMYGPDSEPKSLTVDKSALIKAYEEGGNSSILSLSIDDGKETADVLIQALDVDPVTEFVRHVDFYKFKAGQTLTATIELTFVNMPLTVKEHGATLVKNLDEIEVRCLPSDLVSHIDVDLSMIKTLEDTITIKDLNLPAAIEPVANVDTIIAVTNVEQVKEVSTEAPQEVLPVDEKAEAKAKEDGEESK